MLSTSLLSHFQATKKQRKWLKMIENDPIRVTQFNLYIITQTYEF